MSKVLLLIRPEPQSKEFAAAVEAELPGRFRTIVAPAIRIEPVEAEIELAGVGALLFTSANGVEQFVRLSDNRNIPAYCVGAMTTTTARRAGFDARSAEGDVETLADLVIARHAPESGACLHVRGIHAAGKLDDRLEAAGIETRAAALYDQVEARIDGEAADLLAAGNVDVLTVFSPRTAAIFQAQARAAGWQLGSTTSVSLSVAADAGLGDLALGGRRIASHPGRAGMIRALGEL
ncbi:uroporphyrinogen-III synthase [Amaricoccus macauensis]|uniref:uroporphyrinogen-III synthase n=1 Tax=Amaricoccus macauensis TaxID=57001 RepID=UPI003C79D794